MDVRNSITVSGPQGRKGAAAVLVVVALPAILLIAWMGVEIGLAIRSLNDARGAADAAALAAAARFADGFQAANQDAVAAAQACRGPNGPVSISVADAPGGGGDVQFGHWDEAARTFTPDAEGGPAARVTVRFASDGPNGAPSLLLWRIFQGGAVSFTRTSVAVYSPPKHTTSALLESAASGALDADDSATLSARGGVSVASADLAAVVVRGASRPGAVLQVPVLRMAGGMDEFSRAAVSGTVEEGASITADPMQATALPAIGGSVADDVTSGAPGTIRVSPGTHAHLSASAGTLVLESGVHQFTQSVELSGTAQLVLEDAAIELAPSATFAMSGAASLSGTPLAQGDWQGFGLLQRGVASAWSIAGQASIDLPGRLYAPDAAVSVAGGATLEFDAAVLGSLRIAEDARIRMNGRFEQLDLPVVPGRARLVR